MIQGKSARFASLLAAVAVGAAFASTSATAQNLPPRIKIGLSVALTGPGAAVGVTARIAAEMTAKEINAAGGYLGRPLELIIKDDTASPDVGFQRSQELIKEGVVATIGFCNTGVAMKALEVFQTAKSPLIVPCATGTLHAAAVAPLTLTRTPFLGEFVT